MVPGSVVVLVDYVDGPGKENHDFRLSYNFNTTDVKLSDMHIDYVSKNGVPFELDFVSDVPFTSRLLIGSEDPKGGCRVVRKGHAADGRHGEENLYTLSPSPPASACRTLQDAAGTAGQRPYLLNCGAARHVELNPPLHPPTSSYSYMYYHEQISSLYPHSLCHGGLRPEWPRRP